MKTRLLAASATLAAALLPLFSSTSAAAACDPATRAVQYLAANQLPDGSLDMSSAGGFGNPTATENFVLGAAAAGYDPNTIRKGGKTPFDYLAANPGASNAGRAARLVLTLRAGNTPAGRYDYNNFGGVHPLDVINSSYHSSGTNTGAYGTGLAFDQSLVILALKAAGQTPPSAAVTWLENIRNTGKVSGGYSGEPATDTGWSTGSAADQSQADTNTTAEALQALAAVGNHTQDSAALAFLHSQQNADGGFPLEKPSAFGTDSDPDSDALVLEGIAAATGSHDLSPWTVSGHTPLSNLLAQESPAGSGAYGFPGSAPDTFTTSEVPQGLVQAWGVIAAPTAGALVPVVGCVAAAATTVSAPSPTPAPRLPAAGRGPGGTAVTLPGNSWLAPLILVLVGVIASAARRRREG